MPGPGEYLADRTEGITRVEDLPKAKVVRRSRSFPRRPCPRSSRARAPTAASSSSGRAWGREGKGRLTDGARVAGRGRDA